MRQDDFAIAERVATHENTDGYQIEKNESLYSRTLQRSSREISFENDTNIIIKVIVTVLLFLCDAGSRCRYFLRIKKKRLLVVRILENDAEDHPEKTERLRINRTLYLSASATFSLSFFNKCYNVCT